MSRRQFLARLARASSAAILISSPLGCGTVRGGVERLRLGDAAPIFNSVQQEVVAKIIDGFNPPDTEIRRRLAARGPGLRSGRRLHGVRLTPSGDEFLDNMKFLIDFLNVLPTFTRTFSTATACPRACSSDASTPTMPTATSSSCATATSARCATSSPGRSSSGRPPSTPTRRWPGRSCAIPGPWLAGSGQARRGSRALHLVRHGAGDRRERGRSCGAASWPTAPCATGLAGRPRRGRVRSARPGDRRGRGRLRGGRLVRGRRAGGEDRPADPHPREGRLHRARRVPPARAAHDAAHLRHRVLGARGLRPGRFPPSPPPW